MNDLLPTIRKRLETLDAITPLPKQGNLDGARRIVDALRRGVIFFYGDRPVDVGFTGVDWSGAHVKHQEWPAQLNRFFWLPAASAVYHADRDESLAVLSKAYIEDWMDQHDYAADRPLAPGDNTLNISIRLGQGVMPGWWGAWRGFASSDCWDEAFAARMVESTRGQLDYLSTHLSPGSNWRISHLDCMLYVSMIAPGLDEFIPTAVAGLNEAFWRQIHADGSHEEHNPNSYHGWMCRTFTRLWRLQQGRPDLGLHIDTERTAKMWDYLVQATTPDGGSAGLHDAKAWTPKRNAPKSGHESPTTTSSPSNYAELIQRDAFLQDAGIADDSVHNLRTRTGQWFDRAGQLFLRDDWTTDASHWTFDATNWGGSHCHLSRLSVNLYAHGRALLCDPGSFTYEMTDPFATHCKSTAAHNTINFEGMNQTEADPHIEHLYIDEDLAVVLGQYDAGYFSGPYTWGWYQGKGEGCFGSHQRMMIWFKGRGALIFDLVKGNVGQRFAAHWQFPEGLAALDAAGGKAWTGGTHDAGSDESSGNVLVHCFDHSDDIAMSIHEGERHPIRGWAARAVDDFHPAPMLAIASEMSLQHATMATLIAPFVGGKAPVIDITREKSPRGDVHAYRVNWPDGSTHLVAFTPGLQRQFETAGDLHADGTLAIAELKGDQLQHLLLGDGLRASWQGQTLIDQPASGWHRWSASDNDSP